MFGKSSPRVRLLAAGLSLALGGCATGSGGGIAMLATVSGGQKIRVPLGRGGAELTNEGGVQINSASFTINADKKLVFVFAFTDSRHRPLRNVRVEDVSDDQPALFVETASPQVSEAGQWRSESEPLALSDRRLGWLATIPNSLRVYRFTLTFADGQTLVLHQGTLYPAMLKSATRQALGENY